MPENISPEERLFNVIQDNRSSDPKKKPEALKRKFDSKAIGDFLLHLLPQAKNQKALTAQNLQISLQSLDLKTANNGLIWILAILIVIAVIYSLTAKQDVSKIAKLSGSVSAQILKNRPVEDFKSVSTYLDDVRKRDIFRPVPRQAQPGAASAGLKELIKDLSLSGIFEGEYPEVIIEDKPAKKSYFLKTGEDIKGIKVKTILKDRVILQYGDEEVELM